MERRNVLGKLSKGSKSQEKIRGGDVVEPKSEWGDNIPFTQFGLQRSGTNLTRLLLMKNYNAIIPGNQKSWKHGFYQAPTHHPVSFEKETHVIITVKNPFAWLVSIYNYSHYLRDKPFSDFLWHEYAFEGLADCNPIIHWNVMYSHWSDLYLKDHSVHVVNYEDLLTIPEDTMNHFAKCFDLERKPDPFYIPENVVHPDTTEGSDVFDREYYLTEKYMEMYSKEDIERVNRSLDHDLFRMFYPQGEY